MQGEPEARAHGLFDRVAVMGKESLPPVAPKQRGYCCVHVCMLPPVASLFVLSSQSGSTRRTTNRVPSTLSRSNGDLRQGRRISPTLLLDYGLTHSKNHPVRWRMSLGWNGDGTRTHSRLLGISRTNRSAFWEKVIDAPNYICVPVLVHARRVNGAAPETDRPISGVPTAPFCTLVARLCRGLIFLWLLFDDSCCPFPFIWRTPPVHFTWQGY